MSFVEDRAVRDALAHAGVIRQAQALLADRDPAVRRVARAHFAKSDSDEVRKLVGLPPKKSPTGAAGVIHGQPAGRGTKAVSKTGGSVPGGGGKVARPASTQAKPGSRWAHFAGMTTLAPIAEEPVVSDITPANAAAFITASAAKARGQKPVAAARSPAPIKADMSTPEGVAAFVAASAAKVRAPSR